MRSGLTLILFCLLLPAARAADWLVMDIPNTMDSYYYDKSKLVATPSEVTYWKKVMFRPPRPVKTQLAQSALMRERIDCKEHTLRLLSYLYHDAQGNVIEYVAEAEKEGAPIIPETVGDWFEQALCPFAKAKAAAEAKAKAAAKAAKGTQCPEPQTPAAATFPSTDLAPAAIPPKIDGNALP